MVLGKSLDPEMPVSHLCLREYWKINNCVRQVRDWQDSGASAGTVAKNSPRRGGTQPSLTAWLPAFPSCWQSVQVGYPLVGIHPHPQSLPSWERWPPASSPFSSYYLLVPFLSPWLQPHRYRGKEGQGPPGPSRKVKGTLCKLVPL